MYYVQHMYEKLINQMMNFNLRHLKKFITKNPSKINEIVAFGESFLGVAVFQGSADQVYFLLSEGADPNCYDPDNGGRSPLRLAFIGKQKNEFQKLLQYGARSDLEGFDFRTLDDDLHEHGINSVYDIPDEYWKN